MFKILVVWGETGENALSTQFTCITAWLGIICNTPKCADIAPCFLGMEILLLFLINFRNDSVKSVYDSNRNILDEAMNHIRLCNVA